MRGFRKDRRGLRNKISPLLPREDYKISHVHQLSDLRECGQILKLCMSLHARVWVAPSGFCSYVPLNFKNYTSYGYEISRMVTTWGKTGVSCDNVPLLLSVVFGRETKQEEP